jgi:hypothetical protein
MLTKLFHLICTQSSSDYVMNSLAELYKHFKTMDTNVFRFTESRAEKDHYLKLGRCDNH